MKRVVSAFISVAFALVGVIGLSTHALALSSYSQHSMSGMTHTSAKSLSCATICMNATIEPGKRTQDEVNEEDDRTIPPAPYYVQFQQPLSVYAYIHTDAAKLLIQSEPPPGSTSLGVLFSIFRF